MFYDWICATRVISEWASDVTYWQKSYTNFEFQECVLIPFERAKRALSNAIYSFLRERVIVVKKRQKEKVVLFPWYISTKSYTKRIVDFEKTFSVCKAFNSEHFDKKRFSKSVYFDRDKVKILWSPVNQFLKNLKNQ